MKMTKCKILRFVFDLKKKKTRFPAFILILLLFIFSNSLNSESGKEMNDATTFTRIPIYTFSSSGQPVDGLDRNELRLNLENETVDFVLKKNQQPNKANIIIFDTTHTKLQEFTKCQKIAKNIVNNALPGDSFTIIQLSPLKGFHIIIPRETNRNTITEEISKLKLFPALEELGNSSSRQSPKRIISRRYRRIPDPSKDFQKSLKELMKRYQNKTFYNDQILRFSYFLTKFKNALSLIEKPKIIYLLSGETSTDAIGTGNKYQNFFQNYFNDIIDIINESGSLLFMINPSNKNLLMNNPSAVYYELHLLEKIDNKGKLRIEINSDRKGMDLYYPRYLSVGIPYRLMTTFQKRMFILDLILDEPWTRCAGMVRKATINMLPGGEPEENQSEEAQPHFFQISLPGDMCFKKIDVFSLHINLVTAKVNIDFAESFAKDRLIVPFNDEKNSHGFFIIINPFPFSCIYNEVK